MPATFYVPGCQQKGGNSSAGENVWFYLDFLVAHGGKTVDPCNSLIRRKGVCHRS